MQNTTFEGQKCPQNDDLIVEKSGFSRQINLKSRKKKKVETETYVFFARRTLLNLPICRGGGQVVSKGRFQSKNAPKIEENGRKSGFSRHIGLKSRVLHFFHYQNLLKI